jgi:hypothetical protein
VESCKESAKYRMTHSDQQHKFKRLRLFATLVLVAVNADRNPLTDDGAGELVEFQPG